MDHEQHVDGDTMATDSIVAATTQAELQQDLERIESLRALPDDWNTYGGLPTTVLAAVSASTVLRLLASKDERPGYALVRPHGIAPLASGGLNLEWRGSRGELTLEMYPDGSFGCYTVESRDGETIERDEECPAMNDVVESLQRILGLQ